MKARACSEKSETGRRLTEGWEVLKNMIKKKGGSNLIKICMTKYIEYFESKYVQE